MSRFVILCKIKNRKLRPTYYAACTTATLNYESEGFIQLKLSDFSMGNLDNGCWTGLAIKKKGGGYIILNKFVSLQLWICVLLQLFHLLSMIE